MSGSTILDGNSFRAADAQSLPDADRDLIARRMRVLGPSYRLFYRRPIHLVRGEGTRVYDAEGREYLDAYNNVASVGHANAEVAAAVHRQMSTLNTHSRYLQRGLVEYAEQLLDTFPEALDNAVFTNSGSEANDLALRIAKQVTGGSGVVVTAEAYHGTTALVAGASPAMGSDHVLDPGVIAVSAPDSYRLAPSEGLGEWFAGRVRAGFEALKEAGHTPAAFLIDSIMASDGVLSDPTVLAPVAHVVREQGAIFIADEVQPGFGRTGAAFWGFARHGIVPDLVTLGKPMGNGVPVAAVVGRSAAMGEFGRRVPYFNTFGGSSVPIAAAQAVLNVIRDGGLADRSEELGERLRAQMRALAERHACIGDVRGAGLFCGVEIVGDRERRTPDSAMALEIINRLRDLGVLVSVCGPTNSTLKIRPLLVCSDDDVSLLTARMDEALTLCAALTA